MLRLNALRERVKWGKENGFTILELLIVVAIIGILMAIAIPLFGKIRQDAKEKAGEATPAPTKKPTEVTDTVGAAPDMNILFYLGIAVAVVIFIAAVIWLISTVTKARRTSLELKQKTQELDADKAKALLFWSRYVDEHATIKEKALAAETDWDMLFSYPALSDVSVPQTAAFHRALKTADLTAPEPPADINLSMDLADLPYPKAVTAAGEAWTLAYDFARKVGLTLIPADERKKIDQIMKLLEIARRSGGSDHERNIAYERVAKLVKELHFVRVPERALQALTSESRLMLESSEQGSTTIIVQEGEYVRA